jgi:hypothetical protein
VDGSNGATMTAVGQGSVIFVPKLAQCSTSSSFQSGVIGFVKTIAKVINHYSGGTITGRMGATGVGGFVPGTMPPDMSNNYNFVPGASSSAGIG